MRINKKYFGFFIAVLLLVSLVLAVSYTKEERELIRECKLDCRENYKLQKQLANEEYFSCRDGCSLSSDECFDLKNEEYDFCLNDCSLEFGDDRRAYGSCKRDCYKEYSKEKRECSSSSCKRECSNEKRGQYRQIMDEYRDCGRNCKYTALNSNITCEGGLYEAGENYLAGCNECECGYDGVSRCKLSDTCNFNEFNQNESECISSGGLFQALCEGPYFRLRCSREKYCICDGNEEYGCPANNACIKEFNIPIPPTVRTGFVDLIGLPMGDIGVCAELPEIETCGNGICENVVCQELGCPLAETEHNCPSDCLN